MISHKRDVLDRQSLSEVKMAWGSPVCERVRKKIVEYFKNNVPQSQIAKALQSSSSTVHNIIKRFRETGDISMHKGRGRRLSLHVQGLLGPQTLHHSSACLYQWHYKMGRGILPETTFGKHNQPCHLQISTKALSCKKEAIFEHGPEVLLCPVGQDPFKMDCFKVRRVQIWHPCW